MTEAAQEEASRARARTQPRAHDHKTELARSQCTFQFRPRVINQWRSMALPCTGCNGRSCKPRTALNPGGGRAPSALPGIRGIVFARAVEVRGRLAARARRRPPTTTITLAQHLARSLSIDSREARPCSITVGEAMRRDRRGTRSATTMSSIHMLCVLLPLSLYDLQDEGLILKEGILAAPALPPDAHQCPRPHRRRRPLAKLPSPVARRPSHPALHSSPPVRMAARRRRRRRQTRSLEPLRQSPRPSSSRGSSTDRKPSRARTSRRPLEARARAGRSRQGTCRRHRISVRPEANAANIQRSTLR